MFLSTITQADPSAWILGGLAALGLAIMAWLKRRREGVDQDSVIYTLVPVPFYALVSYLVHLGMGSNEQAVDFLVMQVVGLVLGVVHVGLFYGGFGGLRPLSWPRRERSWDWGHFGFTLLLCLSAIAGMLIAQLLPHAEREVWKVTWYVPSVAMLLVPFLWVKAFDLWLGIPKPVYRPWYALLDERFTYEPDERLPKVDFRITVADGKVARLRDVPLNPDVDLERVYRWILHRYFERVPDVHFRESASGEVEVWGWHFHREKKRLRWGKRLDPMRKVHDLGLRAGDVIIVTREASPLSLEQARVEMNSWRENK